MSERKIRAIILQHTKSFLSTEKFDEWVEIGRRRHAEMMQREDQSNREAVTLAESIQTQEARIERVLEMVASGGGAPDLLKRKLADEEEKLAALRERMAKVLAPRVRRAPVVDADALRKKMAGLAEVFGSKPDEARSVLREFVRRVTMFPTGEGVKFKISLQPSLIMPPAANVCVLLESAGRAEPTEGQLGALE